MGFGGTNFSINISYIWDFMFQELYFIGAVGLKFSLCLLMTVIMYATP
jgi:hypothetical protein